ncbi:MAG TPA: UDP-N-acetylmuramoyl-L-alanine--D-glutamate ligase, partial [Actinomycetota bacterium]|nr:UDP-N-acetylmuramoyl-L-alanine--D-glutamate ligase [Actinomycetota bacterium]
MNLDGVPVLVVGLGQSGSAAVEALRERGASVTVTESRPEQEIADAASVAEEQGARVEAGGHDRVELEGYRFAVTSPGVPRHAPILADLAARGVEIWSELELGARLATAPYVAITGTNGKTTTTELVAEAMRNEGLDAIACGNVGYPFSRATRETHDVLAVEASSFQLRYTTSLHPAVSALLNLAPDHLDWHGSFQDYAAAKARIHMQQRGSDVHVGNADDHTSAAISRRAACRQAWFSVEEADAEATFRDGSLRIVWDGEERELGAPPMDGPTHRANSAAAGLVATAFGISSEAIAKAIRAAEPGRHRGRVVAEVGGVRFVDDSKATNPHAALASIASNAPAVLIAGGLAKGVDLAPLRVAASDLRGVVAIGEA